MISFLFSLFFLIISFALFLHPKTHTHTHVLSSADSHIELLLPNSSSHTASYTILDRLSSLTSLIFFCVLVSNDEGILIRKKNKKEVLNGHVARWYTHIISVNTHIVCTRTTFPGHHLMSVDQTVLRYSGLSAWLVVRIVLNCGRQ